MIYVYLLCSPVVSGLVCFGDLYWLVGLSSAIVLIGCCCVAGWFAGVVLLLLAVALGLLFVGYL